MAISAKMQTAFLRSGIPDQDLVQDAAFFSSLYKFAKRHRVKHIITGSNFSTECCREPEAWGGYLGVDTWLFKDIWKAMEREILVTSLFWIFLSIKSYTDISLG